MSDEIVPRALQVNNSINTKSRATHLENIMQLPAPKVTTLVVDIGDVLCKWNPPKTMAISPAIFKEMRNSPTWYEYNCGKIDEKECLYRLAEQACVPLDDLKSAMETARASQGQSDKVVEVIRDLRKACPQLRVYAMSNISRPDWSIIRAKECFNCWDLFDGVFTSCEAGMAKPELRFYRHVLDAIDASANETIFVDNDETNVLAARSLGFHEAIVFERNGHETLRRKLFNAVGSTTAAHRGRDWLSRHSGCMVSETNTGIKLRENFSQLLIYEIMGPELQDRLQLKHDGAKITWNYFIDTPVLTSNNYPDDVDTTSYALKLQSRHKSLGTLAAQPVSIVAREVMDRMLSPCQTTADGIVKVYFDDSRSRVDPTVCVNVVRLFFAYNRGDEPGLQPTFQWIKDVLFHRAYLNGTRYYHTPEAFLYFWARLLHENPSSCQVQQMAPLLRERLAEIVNSDTGNDAMALAMRLLACHYVRMPNRTDACRLLALQEEDGSFGLGWLCRYGKSQVLLGSRFLTAALAIRAIECTQTSRDSFW